VENDTNKIILEVKTERFSRAEGKALAFVEGEVQRLLGAIETPTHIGLRDRALLGTLAYSFARIGAVVNLKVEDYYPSGKRFLLRFREKGGKEKELPMHHKLEELLDEYLKATGLGNEPGSPLFPAALGKTGKLSRRSLVRTDAADMLKRRLKQAGLPAHYSPHSFRATGITNFLENDGTLEPLSGSPATQIAGPQTSMIAEAKRFFSKTWSVFGTDRGLALVPRASGDDKDGRITRSTIFEAARSLSVNATGPARSGAGNWLP
jgi:integrase